MTPKEYCILRKLNGKAFAKRVGITKYTASRLLRFTAAERKRFRQNVSAAVALQVHKRTRGQIDLHELRPDIWPPPAKSSTPPVAAVATACQPEQTAPAMLAGEGR